MRNNPNVTLHFHIEKVSMKDISIGYDKLTVNRGEINGDILHMNINYTKPGTSESIFVLREVTSDDVLKQKLKTIPHHHLVVIMKIKLAII